MDTSVALRTVNGETPISLSLISARRLIRHHTTEEYYGFDGWTADINEALQFKDSVEAAQACIKHDLRDVDLVLQPGDAGTDLFRTTLR